MVILWDTDSGELLRTMNEHTAPVRGISFSPDGNLLATVDEEGRLLFWGVTP
jgi:WD40 repeat protein